MIKIITMDKRELINIKYCDILRIDEDRDRVLR